MPKRVIDGASIATSQKLLLVPARYRGELALLLTLQLANGVFEVGYLVVWALLYAFNRPDFTPAMVREMLDAFEGAKMLFRWTEPDGKAWGHFVGSDKPGRLPGKSRRGRNEKVGPPIPAAALADFLRTPAAANGNNQFPNGNDSFPGSGSGIGSGSGSGPGIGAGIGNAYGKEPNANTKTPSPLEGNSLVESTTRIENTEDDYTAEAPSAQVPLTRASATVSTPTTPQHSTPASVNDIVMAYPMTPTNGHVRQGWLVRTEEEVQYLVRSGQFTTSQGARDFLLDRVQRYGLSQPERVYALKKFLDLKVYDQGWLNRDDLTQAVAALLHENEQTVAVVDEQGQHPKPVETGPMWDQGGAGSFDDEEECEPFDD